MTRTAAPRCHQPSFMSTITDHLNHARSLQADILAAPGVTLPRRAVLLEWLEAFLARAKGPGFELGEHDASDLRALDLFLRRQKVPVAS
jgi:hypothetical protein